jgi:hypothetical protein
LGAEYRREGERHALDQKQVQHFGCRLPLVGHQNARESKALNGIMALAGADSCRESDLEEFCTWSERKLACYNDIAWPERWLSLHF